MKTIIKAVLLLLVVLLALTACTQIPDDYKSEMEEGRDYHEIEYYGKEYSYNTTLQNILVIGTDSKSLEGQADFLGLFVIDRENKRINLINIPRETKIQVELWEDEKYMGMSNAYLNMVYPFAEYNESGAKATMAKVSEVLNGIPIIDYFVCTMQVFEYLNWIFGDFTITLEDDSLAYLNKEWVAGYEMPITKETTMTFLRSRDTESNNSAKMRRNRQNLYLKEIHNRINEIDEYAVVELFEKSLTSLSLDQIEALLDGSYAIGDFETLPGSYSSTEYYDEFEIDEQQRDKFVVETFYVD